MLKYTKWHIFYFLPYNVYSPIFSNENNHICFTLRRRSTNWCIFYFYQRSSQAAFCLFIIFSPCVGIGSLSSWAIDQLPHILVAYYSDPTTTLGHGTEDDVACLGLWLKKNTNVINLISFKIKLRPTFGMESLEHITATLGCG